MAAAASARVAGSAPVRTTASERARTASARRCRSGPAAHGTCGGDTGGSGRGRGEFGAESAQLGGGAAQRELGPLRGGGGKGRRPLDGDPRTALHVPPRGRDAGPPPRRP